MLLILMSTSDELNLAQDRLTSEFVTAAWQLKIDIGDNMISYFIGQMFDFYENSNLKYAIFCTPHKSFRNLKIYCWNNLVFSELGTSD